MALIAWCDTHHKGQLVIRHIDVECDDTDTQKRMRTVLQRIKRIAMGADTVKYADSLALMDQRFTRTWRCQGLGR